MAMKCVCVSLFLVLCIAAVGNTSRLLRFPGNCIFTWYVATRLCFGEHGILWTDVLY